MPQPEPGWSARMARRGKPLARRFILGIAYGAGTAVGGYLIWWVQFG
ncbi:hypothetical protein ABZ687_29145 [Streptomyces ardesiacus]